MLDRAIASRAAIQSLLQQAMSEAVPLDESRTALCALAGVAA
jgi:flagellar biosynthesis/type III secretory pathway ATPase